MKTTQIIAKASFWISVVLGALGQIISFYPGAELGWFGLAAIFSVPGLLIPTWSFRSASLIMLILWSAIAVSGQARGKEYQEWVKQRETKLHQIGESRDDELNEMGTNASDSHH